MKEAGDCTECKSPKLSEFNFKSQENPNWEPPAEKPSKSLRHRLHLPSQQGIKKVIHPKKPLFGKDGPRGSWYVRIPLWLQTTILIFFIGFLSLLVLTLVSAIKVWSYTESLMKNRLSTLAGMTGIEIEQGFDSLERSVTYSTSTGTAVDFLTAANNNNSMTGYWDSFNKEFGVEISLSDCLAMELYDKNLDLLFSYRKRTSSNRFSGQQDDMVPRELFPLSQLDLRENMLANLDVIDGGVLANATANQVYAASKSVNLTYSVSQKITSEPQINIFDGRAGTSNNGSLTDIVGYSTFVFKNQVTSSIVKERLFPQYIIEIVRLNDIILNNTFNKDTNTGTFSFLYPFVSENGTTSTQQNWTISSFPVLKDALDLMFKSYNETLTVTGSSGSNATSTASPVSPAEEGDDPDLPGRLPLVRRGGRLSRGGLRKSSNGTEYSRFNNTDSNTTSSTNSGQGDIPNQFNTSASANRNSVAKLDAAHMKTKTPFDDKSSVGYSYASVYDQKWLVFVEIPESEAFNDARHLRNVIVGVGAGILGAVLLILLPLSRWQTRGFYIIYQNMKLRPILFLDESVEKDPEVDPSDEGTHVENDLEEDSSSQDDKPEVGQLADVDDSTPSKDSSFADSSIEAGRARDIEAKQPRNTQKSSENNTKAANPLENSANTSLVGTSPIVSHNQNRDSINFEAGSLSIDRRRYRFNTPKPLPPLNRWFSDEVDDLIQEYNNMTEKLNAYYLHLEDQVRLRTHEAQKARELREEANAAKSEFIAIISHELRTPLNGIMGLTAVNADEDDVAKIQSALKIIIESGHVLMDLLNELLELSKSLVGVEPSVTEFTPIELLETLPTLFSPRTPVLTTHFALAAVPHTLGNLKLRGDLDHISHICLNFMSNAMKFSDQNGNVSVILHIRPLEDPLVNLAPYGETLENANAVLEILVTDSGVGISSSQLAKIFDLFVQGEDPLRKNQKGAGLGMALSKQLAEGIGGYIAVFSAKGVGTTTVLHVPVQAVGLTPEDVLAFNGPPIEFKVRDVYSTISLKAGEVQLLQDQVTSNLTARTSVQGGHVPGNHSSGKRSRHSHQTSNGSRLLLNRAHPVSKLLRSQSQHHHNHSQYSNTSHGSQGSGRTAGTSEAVSLKGSMGPPHSAALPTVVGVHGNHSASSFLLNVPDGMFDDERENVRTSIISTGTEFFEASQSTSERNSPTPVSSTSGPKTGLAKYGATVQRRNSTMLKIIPPALSFPRESSLSAASRSPAVLPDSTPNTASSETTTMMHGSPERSSSPPSEVNSDARVLLAEDNKLNQEIMVKMLQHLGISHVDTAGDGNTVIKLVEQSIVDGFHYSIIFMDLSMPGMDGLDATQFIRGTLGYPYPIVALTGFSDIETRNACMALNIQEVLTKPVMKFDIVRVLEKYTST